MDETREPHLHALLLPDQFCDLIESHGFTSWTVGGYNEEPYGEGGELVVAFR